jgi:Undecaprenyl-phosphate glucose phosphotransferase
MNGSGRVWPLFVLDLSIMFCLYYWFYQYYSNSIFISSKAILFMGCIALMWMLITISSNLYNLTAKTKLYDLLLVALISYSLLSAFAILAVSFFSQFKPNANLILYPLLIAFATSIIIRCIVFVVRKHFVEHGYMKKNILVVGGDKIAELVINKIKNSPYLGYGLNGVIADCYNSNIPKGIYLGKLNRINDILESNMVDEVLIALPMIKEKEIISVVKSCEYSGVRFRFVPDFYRLIQSRGVLDYMDDIPLISIRTEPLLSFKNRFLKRNFDIIFSFCALTLLSPVFFVFAVIIKMTSPGSVFFKQKRVGSNNQEFEIYKFRTMKVQETNESDTVWTTANDDRVTSFGKFLRKYNLDELPQFWNVFIGTMSVVGPRPERKHFVEQFKTKVPRYKVRHQVKSGISGWAQVNGLRGDTSIAYRVEHDLYYIENWTIWFDMIIIWKTVFSKKTNLNAY